MIGIFVAEMLAGTVAVCSWMGKAIIPSNTGGVHVLDRFHDPCLCWSLVVGIFLSLVVLPGWFLFKGAATSMKARPARPSAR